MKTLTLPKKRGDSLNRRVSLRAPVALHVLWYDTEQSDESTQDILKNRILPMIGEAPSNSPEGGEYLDTNNVINQQSNQITSSSPWGRVGGVFDIFNVRQEPWRERLPLLELAIEQHKPDLVIVDGIRDLVNDINDGVLAQETIERLMLLASKYHCCIANILHQNKAAEDKNLRGWIGTELTHKAFEVYEAEKDDNRIFLLSQKLTRKYDIIDTLKYVVDEGGIPQLACIEEVLEGEQRQRQQHDTSRPELNHAYIRGWEGNNAVFDLPSLFGDAMPEEGKLYVAKDMQEKVMKLANITSPYFYNRQREQALSSGIIIKTANEFNHICYYRPVTKKQEQVVEDSETPAVNAQMDLFADPVMLRSDPPNVLRPYIGDYVLGGHEQHHLGENVSHHGQDNKTTNPRVEDSGRG